MVHAKILGSHQLNLCSIVARYLYVGTIVLADDDGRLNGDPRYLKGQVFSYDEDITIDDVNTLLKALYEADLIELYEVDGTQYIQHPKWKDYQKIRKDMYTASKIPSSRAVKAEPVQTRNEAVTEPVPKLSQVKLNKDKLNKPAAPKAPPTKTEGSIINEILEGFKEVNPSYSRLYAQKPQRQALDRLIEQHGREKIENVIGFLPKSNAHRYAPTITTPMQLEKDLGRLLAWAKKEKDNSGKGKKIRV